MAFIEPLNLEQLLVANFAGSSEIFIFVVAIMLSGLAAKLRMPNGVALPMFAIFTTIMMGTVLAGSFTGLYVVTLVLSSFFVFYGVTRYFQ